MDLPAVQAQSESRLGAWGLKVNPHLPPQAWKGTRDAAEVGRRAVVLAALAEVGEGAPPGLVQRWTSLQGLEDALTPRERALLAAPGLTPLQRDDFRWGQEAAWALAWAIGRAPGFAWDGWAGEVQPPWPGPRRAGRVDEALAGVALLPAEQLLAEGDLALRLHWAAVDAAMLGEPFPVERFHPDAVLERRRALTWVLSPGTAWDAVDLGV
ncbi:MAG: hypothetical protein RL653_2867 [Pseudomonadota bacterium]|jgi:hypothetical protein